MPERNHRQIGTAGNRELWTFDGQRPDGEWMPMFRGKSLIEIDGYLRPAPDDGILFSSEHEARKWLGH